jgi:ABC-type transport system involved in multi-copper enzyme maturation permease subunit
MRDILTIARLSIGEARRRKVLWVLTVLGLVVVALVAFAVSQLVAAGRRDEVPELTIRLAVSQVLIFIAFQFGFVQAMTAAFLAAPAIASDLESGVALAVLARPIRRSAYLLGRWVGLAVVLVAYGAGSALVAILVVGAVSGYLPPSILTPLLFIAAEGLVVLTFAMLLSTRLSPIAGGAITVVAFGLTWIAGVIENAVDAFTRFGNGGSPASALGLLGDVGRVVLPADGLWRGVIYGLEPTVVIAAAQQQPLANANPFFAAAPPTIGFLLWVAVWVAAVLGLAIWSLNRREP